MRFDEFDLFYKTNFMKLHSLKSPLNDIMGKGKLFQDHQKWFK